MRKLLRHLHNNQFQIIFLSHVHLSCASGTLLGGVAPEAVFAGPELLFGFRSALSCTSPSSSRTLLRGLGPRG